MNTPTAPPGAPEDWATWEAVLTQFSQATHCTTSLYTSDGQPMIGPVFNSDTGVVLEHSPFFRDGGEGRRFEQALVLKASLQLEVVESTYMQQLAVVAVPIVMFGRCHGAVVFGWLPVTFATALGAARIAAAAGADGRRLWTVLRLQPPVGANRVQVYARFMASLVDAHARLRETMSEIEAVTRLREESLARVAHELRTPLSSVTLRLSTLLSTELADRSEVRATLEAVLNNIRQGSRLIDDIFDTTRSQTGQLSISPVVCDIGHIVSAAVETILPQAMAKGVRIVDTLDPREPRPVRGDTGRLQQAFWNLLANAVKFTPAGGTVTIEHRRREYMHDVSIRDDGIGIPRQMLGRVFVPFVRERTNNEQGLGLGLPIARHIVELHGGRILVESDGRGAGSTFTVVLPAHDTGKPPAK